MIKQITVIGSGVMGSGIAQSFAVGGYSVVVNDIKPEYLSRAEGLISDNLSLLEKEGVLTEQEKQNAHSAITYTCDLAKAVREADFIVEAIPEVIEMKWRLYQELERLMKQEAVLASNTSTFPISRLAEKTPIAQRMIITHFFNPAHLVPLVEIVKHDLTKPEVVEETLDLIRSIGKSPTLLKKEIPGFVANRLQTALMREAFYLLKEGVASAEDIDTAVTAGPGFRWAFTGPIEIADFGGLDTWKRVFDNVAPDLDQSIEAPALIRDFVEQGKLGTKSGEGIYNYETISVSQKLNERDRHYIQLGRIKREEV
ncbi:3-hydroxyacyl-CoA dehydrogenase family protein [Peribacillus cavernae]|uniref:3-hydroxyacyl-CoA dehydrogenase family protein n=1 Tax=Peribacillus cavernae TaxID=1674310 RepID=A0A3S0U9G3_9BACI|nr:3-hydroxyacyl-CoA dehydrogenase family protein [Peribacillus cavernae]MDQ0220845.1 3-hydroxybutyryl-CoA dehydrogenase [Peribacillus cavernae]RUQ24853.1 3-hydroxyacyl-CoA dehydrogenase family protein [Peribacillus cavernae]